MTKQPPMKALPAAMLFAGLLATPPASAAAIGPGAIAASVRDGAGRPVAGVHVFASGPAEREAISTAAGIVTLLALPYGTYTVRAFAGAYAPFETSIALAPGATSMRAIEVRLEPADSGTTRALAGVPVAMATPLPAAANAIATLAQRTALAIVPGDGTPASLGLSIDGAPAYATRYEIDGIPLAGSAASGRSGLRFAAAPLLARIEVVPGIALRSPAIANAAGGVVEYRTAPAELLPRASGLSGYDSAFGAFARVAARESVGRLAISADVLGGGGFARAHSVKATFGDPSSSLALDVFGQAMQSAQDGINLASAQPAFAIAAQTRAGTGVLQARYYASAFRTGAASGNAAWTLDDDRIGGATVAYAVPFGQNELALAYDRRSERALEGGTVYRQTLASGSLRARIVLDPASTLELGAVRSGGDALVPRTDVQYGLTHRASDRLTLRLAAGRTFDLAPLTTLPYRPASGDPVAPESAAGARFAVEYRADASTSATLEAFSTTFTDRFANFSGERARGLSLALRRGAPVGLSYDAEVAVQRAIAFGSAQPVWRAVLEPFDARNGAIAGLAPLRARAALSFAGRSGLALGAGATFLGNGNALGPGGLWLYDLSLGVPLGPLTLQASAYRAPLQNGLARGAALSLGAAVGHGPNP